MVKLEKQSNPKVLNLLRRKVTLKRFGFSNRHRNFKMVKQVLIEQR